VTPGGFPSRPYHVRGMATPDDPAETDLPVPNPPGWKRWAVLTVVVAGIALFFALGPDEAAVIRRSAEWRAAARENLFTVVVVFFLAEVVLIGLSVPIGIWLSVLAGFLFGTLLGTVVVSFASTAGGLVATLAARYVFAAPLRRLAAVRPQLGRALAAIDRGFRRHGAYYIILLRMTPVFPFWLLNLGVGLTPVRVRTYWWASQLGMLPMTLVLCHAGASLAEITSFRDVLSPRVLGALMLMPLVPFVLHHTAGRWLANRERGRAG
jgi:uncharacterized membrane protein YdjX (TVP38/TMEM64 family)